MNLPSLSTRNLFVLAIVTSVAWATISALSLALSEPKRFLDVLMFVPFTLTLVGIAGLHVLQRSQAARLERIGFQICAIAGFAGLVGQAAVVADFDALKWIGFPVGILALLVGLALFGIGTVQSKVLPRGVGIALALSQPLAFAAGVAFIPISPVSDYGDYSGAIAHAVVWFVIARELRVSIRSTTSQQGQEAVALAG
jgi:hypothetical protein